MSCSLTWNWSLWLTPWHNCPGGDCRGERQGELHGCTMTAGEEREISHVLPLLFTLTHVLSHPGSCRAHLGLAEGRGEAGMDTGWQNHVWKPERPFHSCRVAAAPLGTVWAALTTESSRTLTPRGRQQCLCPAPVCSQLLSASAPGPCLARVGDVPGFRRAMQKAPAAGQPWASFGCICEVQHKASATAERVVQCEGKAWWENRAEFQSNDKRAGVCMAQIPERLEESLKWKELFFYVWRDEKECDKGVEKRCSLLLKIRRGTWVIMRLCSNLKHVTSFPA